MLVPMEALTRTLAAASAYQFGGLTAIVIIRNGALWPVTWVQGIFVPATSPIPSIDPKWFPAGAFIRIFVVNPSAPNDLPASILDIFDRVVYVTDAIPSSVPDALRTHLKAGAIHPNDPSQTYFSSFIASILLSGPPPATPRSDMPPLRSLLRAVFRDGFALLPDALRALLGIPSEHDDFRSEPLDDDFRMTDGGITSKPRSPLTRDSCRLRFDVAKLTRLWDDAVSAGTVPTFHRTVLRDRRSRQTAWRWARAVTNRRIGLAVSGGGATSYRLVPLLELLGKRRVPVDVLGGESGGASLGAYYCRDGSAGLTEYMRAGNLLSIAGLLFAGVTSQPIETGMDWAFANTTLDDLEVRFVPVTTALPPSGPPAAHAVVRGTLGAAVRASGALPIFFARTVNHGVIYSDGSMSAQIPARQLPNYGADHVFACNSIPGPDRRNPISGWPGGELLYRFTYVGPMLDMFVSNGFMLNRIGLDAGLYADVFIDMTPNRASTFEIFEWWRAAGLVEEARRDPRLRKGVSACKDLWKRVRKDP